MCVENDQVTD